MGEDPVGRALTEVLDHAKATPPGAVADYIPELADANIESLAISVSSASGHVYSAGDSATSFTIQSISKPFVYALVLSGMGVDRLHEHVGFEPSGEPFNAISLDDDGRPANPMINAGAIVTSALVAGDSVEERFETIRGVMSAFAGRELFMDQKVYESESATGDRNRALAFLTRATGRLPRDAENATDVYFRQCSLLVTTSDLAVMGATLANGGSNPVTGFRVVEPQVARRTLSLMASCGMYDHAGEWAFRVGIPAKSGVSGGVVAVKPGQFGIGVFSPGLDEAGNSSRGVAALTLLSEEFGLHLLEQPRSHIDPIVSTRRYSPTAVTVVLRGELAFVAVEHVIHELQQILADADQPVTSVTLDMTAVTTVTPAAERMFEVAGARAAAMGCTFAIVRP